MRYALTFVSSSLILFMASPAAHARVRGGGPELAKLLGKMLWREMERLLSLTS